MMSSTTTKLIAQANQALQNIIEEISDFSSDDEMDEEKEVGFNYMSF